MLTAYRIRQNRLVAADDVTEALDDVVWIDLLAPTEAEERLAEAGLGIDVPTRADMQEIEVSSRLYLQDGAAYMTAVLPARMETDDPEIAPVTFILAGNRLVTVRYHEPRPFETFPRRAARVDTGSAGGETVLLALLEAVVDRMADILERAGAEVDRTSQSIFRPTGRRRGRDFQPVLEEIGRKGSLIAHIRDSLATQERLVAFLGQVVGQRKAERDLRPRVKTLARDVRSLADHAAFLSQSITFLLDATLGMVNIDQNATIKIVSVVAAVFLPPTLIASIYGMNFEHMPELGWPFGYPMALGVMVVSAVLPYLFFKYRGWL